jgi:hypothetical protein
MNDKIKQLYNRALYEYFGEEYKNCELDIYPEDQYFAELIIQECLHLCDIHSQLQRNQYYNGVRAVHDSIKQHFGLE